ncbi:MAG: type II secretion system protein J [Microcoleus sp.]
MMATKRTERGFTLIELLLAMAFVSFMLLFVVGATVQLLRTYNKGLAIKSIDQAGRSITDQLSRDIQLSKIVTLPVGANRLCTDAAAYVWNTPVNSTNKYVAPDANVAIQLARSTEPNLCTKVGVLYPALNKVLSAELLAPGIGVQALTEQQSSDFKLIQFQLQITTTGSNVPTDIDIPTGQRVCTGGVDGQFCATSSFMTTVYAAKGGS